MFTDREKEPMSKQKLNSGPIEGYKGTDKDMKCNGFQFVMGENILPDDDDLVMCEHGFHFCQRPSGPFAYNNYDRIFKIKAYDILDSSFEPGADYKQVCRKIVFLEEIEIGGYRNTGDRNTGDRNTGYGNTGDRNTGYWNTGDGNTGYGNTINNSSGFFCVKKQPVIIFDKITKIKREDLDYSLINKLSNKLMQDEPFDIEEFLALPNATKSKIKKLHKVHIEKRQQCSQTEKNN